MRARAPWVKEWLHQYERPFYSCASGRSPEDTVWRQAVRAETAKRQGKYAATFLVDGHKFFEPFSLKLLGLELLALRFPATVARLSLHTSAGGAVHLGRGDDPCWGVCLVR